ncbi:MAG TPA: hypothetical protein VGG38_04045 [Acidimicrobiales bacterium]
MNESNPETDELLPDALVTAEVLNLRSELGRIRRTLQQREEALAVLNRRLVALENGEQGSAGGPLGETARLSQQLIEANERLAQTTVDMERLDWAQAEVLRLQASKMFRYTWPVRRVLSAMRTK